jgi:hypothetical protein
VKPCAGRRPGRHLPLGAAGASSDRLPPRRCRRRIGAVVAVQAQVAQAPAGLEVLALGDGRSEQQLFRSRTASTTASCRCPGPAPAFPPRERRATVEAGAGPAPAPAIRGGRPRGRASPVRESPGPERRPHPLAVGETVTVQIQPGRGGGAPGRHPAAACSPPSTGVAQPTARTEGPCTPSVRRSVPPQEAAYPAFVPRIAHRRLPLRAAPGRFPGTSEGVLPPQGASLPGWRCEPHRGRAGGVPADRAAKGFNVVEVMLVNHDYTGPPNPVPPMIGRRGPPARGRPATLTMPTSGGQGLRRVRGTHGWRRFAPNYPGTTEARRGGGCRCSPPPTAAVCFRFGQYPGTLFRDRPNVLWLAGDFAPPPGSEARRATRDLPGPRPPAPPSPGPGTGTSRTRAASPPTRPASPRRWRSTACTSTPTSGRRWAEPTT